MEKIYTLGEVAEICKVSHNTVRNWVKAEKLAAYSLPGGHYRVRSGDLKRFMDKFGIPFTEVLGAPSERPVKVLVVDEEEFFCKFVARALRAENGEFEVEMARSGAEGLLVAGSQKPDIIILDTATPGINSAQVCMAIRDRPGLENTKIILVSSYPESQEIRTAGKIGAHATLIKPVSLSKLTDTIAELVKGKGGDTRGSI